MTPWSSATLEEVRDLFEDGQRSLSGTEAKILDCCGIGFQSYPIRREVADECVYVVLRSSDYVIFYDDIEDGWEIGRVTSQGEIVEYGCNQWTLKAAIYNFHDSKYC